MFKKMRISAIIPIAIVLIAVIAFTGAASADSTSKLPYDGNLPPWVDQHSAINKIPTTMVNSTMWSSSPVKNPYNGNLPPWIDYNIQTPSPALTIKGNVNNPMALTISQLRALGVSHVHLTAKTTTVDADAVSLATLIQEASPKSGATTVTFTGSDGFTVTESLAMAENPSSVIAFTSTKGLRDCIPADTQNSPRCWVSYLTTITVN